MERRPDRGAGRLGMGSARAMVVYGASGYTGRLVCEQLAERESV